MEEKYKNKYRIKSIRLPYWDYGQNGIYFVTICTKNRSQYFGKIRDGKMHLSDIGEIARSHWLEIPGHFPFVKLGEFIIMPDHVHGLIIIHNIVRDTNSVEKANLAISTGRTTNAMKKWKPGTLGVIINQYKRICTINARIIQKNFAWQSRFYDHIVRDENSMRNISNYITTNPVNWKNDTKSGK